VPALPSPGRLRSLRERLGQGRDSLFTLIFDSGATYILRLSAAVAAYALNVVLVRVMGSTETGNYVYSLSWFWLLSMVPTLGLGVATQRFVPQSIARGEPGYAKGFVLAARRLSVGAAFATALVAVAAVLLADIDPGAKVPLLIALCALPIEATMVVNASLAQAQHRYILASFLETFLRPVFVLLAVVAVVGIGLGLDATTVIALQVAGIALSAALQHVAIARPFADHYNDVTARYQVGEWLRVAIPILLIDLPVGHWIDINIVVAGAYLTPEQLALYNAVLRTVGVVNFGLTAVNAIVSPRIAEAYAEGDMARLMTLTRRGSALMFWPTVGAVAGLAVIGEFVLALFDASFVVGYGSMLVACGGILLMAAAGPAVSLLMMTAHQDRCLLVMAVIVAAIVALNNVLVPLYGLDGAAFALLGSGLVWLLALQVALRRTFGFWANPVSPLFAAMRVLRQRSLEP
jgi:O-antigen/teichoic acid export membrane protein